MKYVYTLVWHSWRKIGKSCRCLHHKPCHNKLHRIKKRADAEENAYLVFGFEHRSLWCHFWSMWFGRVQSFQNVWKTVFGGSQNELDRWYIRRRRNNIIRWCRIIFKFTKTIWLIKITFDITVFFHGILYNFNNIARIVLFGRFRRVNKWCADESLRNIAHCFDHLCRVRVWIKKNCYTSSRSFLRICADDVRDREGESVCVQIYYYWCSLKKVESAER